MQFIIIDALTMISEIVVSKIPPNTNRNQEDNSEMG